MKKYKITPSLYTAWQWNLKLEKPLQELVDTIERKPFETNEAMQAGIDFENDVKFYNIWGNCEKEQKEQYIDCVKEVAGIVKGGDWQENISEDIYISRFDLKIHLTGRTDVIKRDTIYDIKFVNNYEIGKYKESIQHLIYMYCTGLEKFQYVISDGKSVFVESYSYMTKEIESKLFPMFNEFLHYLENTYFEDKKLMDIYKEHWNIEDSNLTSKDACGNDIMNFLC